MFTDTIGHTVFNTFFLSVAAYAALLFSIAVHEFGHWFAAAWCGFCRLEIRFSVIRWKKGKGWGLAWHWSDVLDGIVKVHYRDADRWLRLRYLVFAGAGPVANISIGFGLITLAARSHGTLADALALPALISLILGAANLIPAVAKARRTDGRRIIDAVFNLKDMQRVSFRARLHDNVASLRALYETKAWDELVQEASRLLDESRESNLGEQAVKSLEELVSMSQAALAASGTEAPAQ